MAPAVVTVQGAGYLLQVAIAALLGPTELGVVRSVDAVLGLCVIIASVGMPSLAVRYVAEIDDLVARGQLLARLLLIVTCSGLVVSSVVWALSSRLTDISAVPYLQRLVWVIPLAACARTALNYYQGSRQIRRYSVLSVSVACGVLPLSLVAVSLRGLSGWVWSRYGAEAIALVAAVLPLAGVLRGVGRLPSMYSPWRLAQVGGVLSMSLLVRSSLDNLGTLALVAVGTPTSQIGDYGIGVLVMLGLLVVPACVGSLALPTFVRRLSRPHALRMTFHRTARLCLAATVPLSILGIAVSPLVVREIFPAYGASIPVIQALLVTVPVRSLTTASGALLVALDQVDVTLVANLMILSAGAVLMLSLTPTFGIVGAAWATVGVEGASALVYGLLAKRGLSCHRLRTRESNLIG